MTSPQDDIDEVRSALKHVMLDRFYRYETVDKLLDKMMPLIRDRELRARETTLQGLLDDETHGDTCICQFADTPVCDHNWSLCGVIRDQLDTLQATKKGKEE